MDRGTAFLRVTRLLPAVRWWVYDRRGYGRSVDSHPVDVDTHVDDLIALLDAISTETGRPALVVGHSLGGTVALAAAHRRPDRVAAVVAYESPLSWLEWWPRPGPLLDADDPATAAEEFMRRVAGADVWEGLPETTRERRRQEGPALVAELASVGRAAPYEAAEIAVPVTIAHGSRADEPTAASVGSARRGDPRGRGRGARRRRAPCAPEPPGRLRPSGEGRADTSRSGRRRRRPPTTMAPGRSLTGVSDPRPVSLNPSGPPETVLPTAPAPAREALDQAPGCSRRGTASSGGGGGGGQPPLERGLGCAGGPGP